MERKNRAKSIWENDLRVYLVSLSNNARINLYYRQQNWEDLILALPKKITTKSKNTFLKPRKQQIAFATNNWMIIKIQFGQSVYPSIRVEFICFFFPQLLLKLIHVTNMIQLISSTCTLVYSVLLNELYV